MTPQEVRDLEDQVAREIEAAISVVYAAMIEAIRSGVSPREAAASATQEFAPKMAAIMREAEAKIRGVDVSAVAPDPDVGGIKLSAKLYAEALSAGEVVNGLVQRHAAGFQDARKLALEIYEGYGFRPPDAEPIKFNPRNDRLPRYLRDVLMPDDKVQAEIARAFAGIQVNNLSTPGLRAGYQLLLTEIDRIEAGAGDALLTRKMDIAFFERMRYFAARIARTELHGRYARLEAERLMSDAAVEFVQIRRAPGRHDPCICALIAGRDKYGLGPGVYPKDRAPLPTYHPFCMCVMAPRLDLSNRTASPPDDGADAYFLNRLSESAAGRVMGSQAKRDMVLAGRSAESVVNSTRDPNFHIRLVRP